MRALHVSYAKNNPKRRTFPELVPTPAEREATHRAALELVALIDKNLSRGICHYRDRTGRLLTTLDEVIHAVLNNDLMSLGQAEVEHVWRPKELAA